MNGSSKTRGTIDRDLTASRRLRSIVRLDTAYPDMGIDGVVLANTAAIVAVYTITSFDGDGANVLPKSVVTQVRRGPFERCATAVARAANGLATIDQLAWLTRVETLEDVIRHLQAHDIWPAIEVKAGRKTTALYVGPIRRIADTSFVMRGYDATGKWEGESEIAYAEVVRIEIESRYLQRFNSYMRRKERRR
jgi:hypothetical protein